MFQAISFFLESVLVAIYVLVCCLGAGSVFHSRVLVLRPACSHIVSGIIEWLEQQHLYVYGVHLRRQCRKPGSPLFLWVPDQLSYAFHEGELFFEYLLIRVVRCLNKLKWPSVIICFHMLLCIIAFSVQLDCVYLCKPFKFHACSLNSYAENLIDVLIDHLNLQKMYAMNSWRLNKYHVCRNINEL